MFLKQCLKMNWLLFVTIYTVLCVTVAHGEEISVRVNTIKPINLIDDRFVSFVLNVEGLNQSAIEMYQTLAVEMNTAYVKLSAVPMGLMMKCKNSANTDNTTQDDDEILKWDSLQQWMSSADWIPVISLPYDPYHWKLDKVFEILNAAVGSNLQSCVWQLGSEFCASDALDYVKDLTTLQLIVDNMKPADDWKLIGGDISENSNPMETKLFTELSQGMVDAISWSQPTEICSSIPDESTMKKFSRCELSTWLGVQSDQKSNEISQNVKLLDEIERIRRLGEAARLGFKITFQQVKNLENPLSYFGTLIFKRVMGSKVFDVRMIGKPQSTSHLYSHCAKGKPGALAIMAVNTGNERMKISVKLSDKNTGSELWQYTLTTMGNRTLLNEEEIDYNLNFAPFIKIRHTTQPVELILPPMSVNFWILPLAKIRECLKDNSMSNTIRKYKRHTLSYRPATCRSNSILDSIKRRALQQKLSNRIFVRNQDKKCKCSTKETIETRHKRSVSHGMLIVRNRPNHVRKTYSIPIHAAMDKVYIINRNDVWKGPILARDESNEKTQTETETETNAEQQIEAESQNFNYLNTEEPNEPEVGSTKHTPKFLRYTSDKVTKFVQSLTDRISDWWTAWA